MPEGWRHSAEGLSRASNEGLHAIRGALRELSDAGYARLQKSRDAAGQVTHRWVFFESPCTEKPDTATPPPCTENQQTAPSTDLPSPVKPSSGEPQCGEPSLGKPALLETTGFETTINETTGEGTTVREQPRPPVSFPWETLTDPGLPPSIPAAFTDGLPVDDHARVFAEIRGRKLRFRDQHPACDWEAVVLSEIADAVREHRRQHPTNSRSFSMRGQGLRHVTDKDWSSGNHAAGQPPPMPEPAGWQTHAKESGSVYWYRAWHQVPSEEQERITEQMRANKPAA